MTSKEDLYRQLSDAVVAFEEGKVEETMKMVQLFKDRKTGFHG